MNNVMTFNAFSDFTNKFSENFLEDDRWMFLLKGLGTTLLITVFAILIGITLGFLIAIVRSSSDKLLIKGRRKTFGNMILSFFNSVCKVYLTIIRGTPIVVQLLIIYFVIFQSFSVDKIIVAIIAFGLNSAAYVAEIVRSGIMSVDSGQSEAGRSLGLNYTQTMISIIMPQAFKNVLPALANECIVLLKETSVAGYIGLMDLTKAGDIIRSLTYEAFFPLFAVAIIYLVVVMILTKGVSILERRLRSSEH